MSTNSQVARQLSPQSFLRHNRILIRAVNMLTILGMLQFFYSLAYATQIEPRNITIFFEKGGEPHDRPVDFSIYCYGYYWFSDKLFCLSSLSGTCPHYGCEVTFLFSYGDGWTFCDCEGKTEGEKFISSSSLRRGQLWFDIPTPEPTGLHGTDQLSITSVYFETDVGPHDKPVDFTIDCYSREKKLFSWTGTCPHYGCEIELYVPSGENISFCDCKGETEGQAFISSSPIVAAFRLPVRSGWHHHKLWFHIPMDESTDSDGNEELANSDREDELTDSETDGGNDGGCFITTLLRP